MLTRCAIKPFCLSALLLAAATMIAPAQAANVSNAAHAASGNAVPLDCNKVFAPGDAAGIFVVPAKVSNFGPSGNGCRFDIASGASIVVSILPADNVVGQMLWKEDSANADYVPLAGVGDQAIRVNGYGDRMESVRNGARCGVQLFGFDSAHSMKDITKVRGEELAKRLGALCNRVFAAGS